MKKKYSQPACMDVELGTSTMVAASLRVNTESDAPIIEDPDAILSKGLNDINIWDDEW